MTGSSNACERLRDTSLVSVSFNVVGGALEVPFRTNYFENISRSIDHLPENSEWSTDNPFMWNAILQTVSMCIVGFLFMMFGQPEMKKIHGLMAASLILRSGWHFSKFGLASSRLQYHETLRQLRSSQDMDQLAHVRSFRSFVKSIIWMSLLKVAIWALFLAGAVVLNTNGVRNDFLLASFFIPSAGGPDEQMQTSERDTTGISMFRCMCMDKWMHVHVHWKTLFFSIWSLVSEVAREHAFQQQVWVSQGLLTICSLWKFSVHMYTCTHLHAMKHNIS